MRSRSGATFGVCRRASATLHRVIVSSAILVSAFASESAPAQETHVVTASGDSWAYRDLRSGRGENERVVIHASAGDRIYFRQTDGEHGVIFYRNRVGTTELGTSVIVDKGFRAVSKTDLKPASNARVFGQQNLATPVKQGSAALVTIELTEDFRRPIYFADQNLSTQGRNRMFGVIFRRSAEQKALRMSAADEPPEAEFKMSEAVDAAVIGRDAWDKSRVLLGLGSGERADLRVPLPEEVAAILAANDEDIDRLWPLHQWFSSDSVGALTPFDARNNWHFAITADLDGDNDLDVIALITQAEETTAWWAFLSARRRTPQTFESTRAWLESALQPRAENFHAVARIDGIPEGVEFGKACAVAIDFDHDGRPDVAFSNGDSRLRFSRQQPAFDGGKMSFRDAESIDTELQFGIKPIIGMFVSSFNDDDWPDLLISSDTRSAVFFNRPNRGFSTTDGKPFAHDGSSVMRGARRKTAHNGWRSLLLEDAEGTVHEYINRGGGEFTARKSGGTP